MKKVSEFLRKNASEDNVNFPNEEFMWHKIQIKKEKIQTSRVKSHFVRKPNLIFSSIILAVFITTTPVLAKYSSEIVEWLRNTNQTGIATSLENGFGQSINISAKNLIGTLEVQNIVTDQNGTSILFSLSMNNLDKSSVLEFDEAIIEIDDEKKVNAEVVTTSIDESNKIVGYLHIEEQIPPNSKVSVYLGRINELQLKEKEMTEFEQINSVNEGGISYIEIVSSDYVENQYLLDYHIKFDELTEVKQARLNFKHNGELVPSSLTVFKSPEAGISHQRASLYIEKEKLGELIPTLEYYQIVDYHPELWLLSFNYDSDLAKRASYVMDVSGEVTNFAGKRYQIEKLVITPSKIKLHYEQEPIEQGDILAITYNDIVLQIGDKKFNGYDTLDGYFSFDTNSIFQNVEKEKISLLLKDAKVTYKGKEQDKVLLTDISNEPQTVNTKVHGYPLEITYNTEGNNLIFVSESNDKQFSGVAQSVIYQDDRRIFPENRSNEGLDKNINKQREVFPNINDNDVTVNFFLYSVYEERKQTIVLH